AHRFQYRVICIDNQDLSAPCRAGYLHFGILLRVHVRTQWQFDPENRTLLRHILHPDTTSMLGDYAVTDAEPEPGTFPHGFRGVERIEDAGGVLYARTAVHQFNKNLITFAPCAHPKITPTAGFQNGVHRVVD